jgi:hypothetical protein
MPTPSVLRALALASFALLPLLSGCSSTGESSSTPAPAAVDSTSSGAGPAIPAGTDYGAGITRATVDDFAAVMTSPEEYRSRPVLVRAEVIDVCKTKGCWLKVKSGDHVARVKFHDYSFFLPKDCEGKTAWIEGVVERRTASVEELKHYAGESGTEDPAAITAPATVVGFVATGVRLTGGK